MSKINVAIADDNQRIVEMMTQLLEQDDDIKVVGSADNGETAVEVIENNQPDVVLLDIIMPKLDGIGVLEKLKEANLDKKPAVIMLSAMGLEAGEVLYVGDSESKDIRGASAAGLRSALISTSPNKVYSISDFKFSSWKEFIDKVL